MKTTWIALPLLVLLVVACDELGVTPPPTATMESEHTTLPEAIEQGSVEAEFVPTGSASGDVIVLRIKRTVPGDLSVTVPTGAVLLNSSASEQDMVLRRLVGESTGGSGYYPTDTVALTDDDEHEYVLEAYCLEAHKDNPSGDSSLSLSEPAYPDVLAVLEAIDQVPEAEGNIKAIQAAVWAITDDVALTELDDVNYSLSGEDLDVAKQIVEGAGLDPASFGLFSGF